MSEAGRMEVQSSSNLVSLSNDTTPTILIEKSEVQTISEEKEVLVRYCNAPQGWCKNVCQEGKTICDVCTKMMESYP